jgi:hypothetical protein
LLLPVTFLLIASCVTVYGLLARPIVRLLRLGQRHPQGLLVLGANPVARTLSRCLQSQGVRALLVDSNRHAVRKARLAGLEVEDGQLLSSRVLDPGRFGQTVAVNRGMNAKAFETIEAARSWLGIPNEHGPAST